MNDLEVVHSPIQILHSQSHVQSGLGISKPPKKRCKMATGISKASSNPSAAFKPPAANKSKLASDPPAASKLLAAKKPLARAPNPPVAPTPSEAFLFSD